MATFSLFIARFCNIDCKKILQYIKSGFNIKMTDIIDNNQNYEVHNCYNNK